MKIPDGGQQGLWGVVDRLIPAELLAYDDKEALYKTRVLVCVSLASGVTQSVVSLLFYLYRDGAIFHEVLVSCSALCAMVYLAIPWLFHRFHSFLMAANLYGLASALSVTCLFVLAGKIDAPITLGHWAVVSVFAYTVAGLGAAAGWTLTGLVVWVMGVALDVQIPGIYGRISLEVAQIVSGMVAASAILGLMWFCGYYQDRLRSRLQIERDRALFSAAHDTLTGIGNRKSFELRLERTVERNQLFGGIDAVLMIDLDGFKQINDSWGHQAGDKVLSVVAERLDNNVRRSDLAARMGGDEFAVLLCDLCEIDNLEPIIKKLYAAVVEPISLTGEQQVVLGASIGIALVGRDGDSMDALLHNADSAMYHAKEAGVCHHYFSALDVTGDQGLV